MIADTEKNVYEVSESGAITEFTSTPKAENRRCFLDKLNGYQPNLIGNLKPKPVNGIAKHAQWLEGIGAGAWFEIYNLGSKTEFRYRRISPYGNIDCDGVYKIEAEGFDINAKYQFIYYCNCSFFHIEQDSKHYRFDFIKNYEA